MQIICISRGSQSRGEEFARGLASKLGYECISREEILEEATRRRIPIGKLETAIIKPHIFTEKLALELESYKALATSMLCEKALKGNIVYHGRTGHLLLPGISHILKIRVVSEPESRIEHIMQKLQLPRDKAKRYIEQVDDDRRKWVKTFYNVDWDIFNLYDMILNLSYINVNNAAAAVCNMAQLPEFQATPSTVNALKDLYLASRARCLLLCDRRTSSMNVKVKANGGIIYITYPIQHADSIQLMNEILHELKDAKEIVYTKAQTNILWIQEEYNADDSSYNEILSLANTWDAAVELMKLAPDSEQEILPQANGSNLAIPETWRETGIIEDSEETDAESHPDMSRIYEKLIKDGRAGGRRAIRGSQKTLINAVDRSANYKLIVFDNAFLSKGASVRKRTLQEWSNSLNDSLKIPVVNMTELQYKYRFKPRQFVNMFLAALMTAFIIFLIFRFNSEIVSILSNEDSKIRITAAICVLAFVPLFAWLYSSVTGLFLKMIKLE